MARARTGSRTVDIWPGFVDALATLILVIVFVLMIFTLFQFYLKDVISNRDDALAQLSSQIGQLADQLALERRSQTELRQTVARLTDELRATASVRERLEQELAAASLRAASGDRRAETAAKELEDAFKTIRADKETIEAQLRELDALRRNIETLTILRDELEKKIAETGGALASQRNLTADAQARVDLLTRQINALQEQMARLNAALEASEDKQKTSQAQIADLGRRLNLALASRVEELARFRSEFFGRLRQVLGNAPICAWSATVSSSSPSCFSPAAPRSSSPRAASRWRAWPTLWPRSRATSRATCHGSCRSTATQTGGRYQRRCFLRTGSSRRRAPSRWSSS